MTKRKQLYPGWRTMTGAQRYNARMHRIFDEARRLEAEKRAKQDAAAALRLRRATES